MTIIGLDRFYANNETQARFLRSNLANIMDIVEGHGLHVYIWGHSILGELLRFSALDLLAMYLYGAMLIFLSFYQLHSVFCIHYKVQSKNKAVIL